MVTSTKSGVNSGAAMMTNPATKSNVEGSGTRLSLPPLICRQSTRTCLLSKINTPSSHRINSQRKLNTFKPTNSASETNFFATRHALSRYLAGDKNKRHIRPIKLKRRDTPFQLERKKFQLERNVLTCTEEHNHVNNTTYTGLEANAHIGDTDGNAGSSSNITDAPKCGECFKCAVKEVQNNLDLLSIKPLFSSWKISGFKHDKVILSSLSNMEEEQQVTPEFVTYIKERDAALEEVRKARAELQESQSKLYDAMKLIDELEQKVKDADSSNKATKNNKKGNAAPAKKNAKPASQNNGLKVNSRVSDGSSGISSARASSVVSSVRVDGTYHPPIDSIDPTVDSCEYYWKVAEMFPALPMFHVLDAEKKFIKADIDNSGTIDSDELDKVLTQTVTMFTSKQLDEIFAEVDSNKSSALDFQEVLVVLNKLVARRKTNLPQSIQQNYSKTCNLQ